MAKPAIYDTDIDDAVSQAELTEYARGMGISAKQAVLTQAPALVVELAKLTAPFGSLGGRENWGAQKKIGLAAVARDIGRLLVPIEELKVLHSSTSPKLKKRMDSLIRRKDVRALKSIMIALRIRGADAHVWFPQDLKAFHNRSRNRRGGVGRRPIQAFVRKADGARFIREKQARVLRAKGGWTIPALALGAKLPGMVTKHAAPGNLLNLTDRPANPYVLMTNNVSYIQEALGRVSIQFALRNRQSAMKRQMEYAQRVRARRATARMNG